MSKTSFLKWVAPLILCLGLLAHICHTGYMVGTVKADYNGRIEQCEKEIECLKHNEILLKDKLLEKISALEKTVAEIAVDVKWLKLKNGGG